MKKLITALRNPRDYRWFELRPFQRHSLVLAVAGILYIGLGAAYAFSPANPQRNEALQLALVVAPLPAWAGVWVLIGLLAILSARWPPASKTWGYSALTGMAACWSGFFFAGLIFGAPATSNVAGGIIFATFAFAWWAIAGLVNPDDVLNAVADAAANDDDGSHQWEG